MVLGNMTTYSVLLVIIAALLSGLIGTAVSTHFYHKHERRKFREDTVRRLIGNRFNLRGDEFSQALNEIFIVFADSKEVITALKDFWEVLQTPNNPRSDDKLVRLLKAICKDTGIDLAHIDDSQFLKTFNITKQRP